MDKLAVRSVQLTLGVHTVKVCKICDSTTNVSTLKIGDSVCRDCAKPMALVHGVFGGKVEMIKEPRKGDK